MKNSINLCIAILLLIVLGCSCPQKLKELSKDNKSPTPEPFSSPSTTSSPTIKKGEYDVSMAKYNQISVGTPRADV